MTTITQSIDRVDFADEDKCWDAVKRRLPEARQAFVYAVRTTGVFCRPTCSSRLPHRQNVHFFSTSSEAQRAGYRACKKCNPQRDDSGDASAALIHQACRKIEISPQPPSLEQLAADAGMSSSRFHRVFKDVSGLTPKQYAAALQAKRVRQALLDGESVTQAVYEAGFSSGSRFYEKSVRILGMQPSVYGAGGVGESIFFACTKTSLGWMLVAATSVGVCDIALADECGPLETELRNRFHQAAVVEGNPEYRDWIAEIALGIESSRSFVDLPLDIQGTAFMRRVWAALQEIPLGETRTYSEVAAAIGQPTAARAVAGACAKNRVAVAIPCHRVVRRDGSPGGYRWGLKRKQALLKQEANGGQ